METDSLGLFFAGMGGVMNMRTCLRSAIEEGVHRVTSREREAFELGRRAEVRNLR
jgi:hypothetical protein